MRVTPMHRIRVGSLRTSPSTNFASSKPRYLLRVLQAVLIFVTSALLSQASLVPSTLVSATTPTWHSVSLPLGQGLYGTAGTEGIKSNSIQNSTQGTRNPSQPEVGSGSKYEETGLILRTQQDPLALQHLPSDAPVAGDRAHGGRSQ
jgi:hypothetical protein